MAAYTAGRDGLRQRRRAADLDHMIDASLRLAVDQQAQSFYEQFGFSLLGSGSRRLFLPLKSV